MKNKRIYIYISPVLVILIFTAITFGILNGLDKVDAGQNLCPFCGVAYALKKPTVTVYSIQTDGHFLASKCSECGKTKISDLEAHSYGAFSQKDSSSHYKVCTICRI